jgi:hypothetical protein
MSRTAAAGLLALLSAAPLAAPAADLPTIAHVPVDTIRAGDDLVVEATVHGTRPIARVLIAYYGADRFGDTALENTAPFTYRARIPTARLGRSFTYIIHANDEGGRSTIWPPSGPGAPGHRVTVVAREEAPR